MSSQTDDGGCESPAAPHPSMNMHGSQVFFSSLLSAFQADAHGGGSRPPLELPLLHYTSTAAGAVVAMPHPRSGISADCGWFVLCQELSHSAC